MSLQNSWDRYALLGYIAKHYKNTLNKPAIQSLIYLLQESKGVPIGYDYVLYNCSPYSSELSRDIEYLDFLGVISLHGGIRLGIKHSRIYQNAKSFLEKHSKKINEVLNDFSTCSAKEMDLRGVIYYCYRFAKDRDMPISRKKIIKQASELRRHKTLEVIEAAVDDLSQKGYLDFRQAKVVLSIKPVFAEKIFTREKKYEFRRAIFKRKNIKKVVVYVSSPQQKVIGEFEVEGILSMPPEELWAETEKFAGISKEYFMDYFKGKEVAHALKIKNPERYEKELDLGVLYNIKPPQSFAYVKEKGVSYGN